MDESVKYLHSRNFTIPLNRNHQLIFSENNSAWGLHHSTRSPPSQMLYPTYRNLAPAVAYKPNVKAICSHTHGMRPCARRVCVCSRCATGRHAAVSARLHLSWSLFLSVTIPTPLLSGWSHCPLLPCSSIFSSPALTYGCHLFGLFCPALHFGC